MVQSSVFSQASSDPDEVVVGVDTHQDVPVAAVLTALGVLQDTKTLPATAAGYQALLAWVGTVGVLRRAGVECTGCYGAALARSLRAVGVEVIEVNQPDKATRRRRGNTDPLDAQGRCPGRAQRPGHGQREGRERASRGCCGVCKLDQSSAVKARTQTINQPESRARRGRPSPTSGAVGSEHHMLICHCAQREASAAQDVTSAAVYTLHCWPGASWR